MPTFVTSLPNLLSGLNQAADSGARGVMGSIQRAAAATGVDFGYLVKTARRESSLNPRAHAPTSSAAGLFQFIEQTWLGVLKANGGKHGYGSYAAQIVQGRDGHYSVTNPQMRRQILSLRYDADANAVMAAEMTAGHAAYLKGRIGRAPSQGELYAAHFLGPDGAANLIAANGSRPGARAASLFPDAARANPSIFYNHGRALNVAEVMARLTATGGDAAFAIPDPTDDDTPQSMVNPLLVARLDKIRSDEAMMKLVFGDSGQQGMLFNTQLLSAFGPGGDGDDGGDEGEAALGKAFGVGDDSLG